jgi:hypothetical protein
MRQTTSTSATPTRRGRPRKPAELKRRNITTRLSPALRDRVETARNAEGVKIGVFIERAIIERIDKAAQERRMTDTITHSLAAAMQAQIRREVVAAVDRGTRDMSAEFDVRFRKLVIAITGMSDSFEGEFKILKALMEKVGEAAIIAEQAR